MARPKNLKRDSQIQHLHRQGMRNAQIARELNTSPATVSRALGLGPRKGSKGDIFRRIEMLELQTSLLGECAYWISKIPNPWGRSLFQRTVDILSR